MSLTLRGSRFGEGVYERPADGVSDAAESVESWIDEIYADWSETLTSRRSALEFEFARLAMEWKTDTEFESSITRIAMHPSYQRIVGMGPVVLPLILRDLEQTHDAWFWALRAITGEDPISPEDRGVIHLMALAWVKWGVRENLL
jgi:hypothetical protein